jgi:hypothetical protein
VELALPERDELQTDLETARLLAVSREAIQSSDERLERLRPLLDTARLELRGARSTGLTPARRGQVLLDLDAWAQRVDGFAARAAEGSRAPGARSLRRLALAYLRGLHDLDERQAGLVLDAYLAEGEGR